MPGIGAVPLVGKLHLIRLDVFHSGAERGINKPFEALSYIWGSDSKARTLELPTGSIGLTESLYSFLSKVRREDQSRLLWADTVCINQNNNLEKV